jgi:outer membrane autotransporter protein
VQVGADWSINPLGYQTVLLGVLGGYVGSKVEFNSPTTVDFSGGSVGAYATYLNRGFFADALFLANFLSMDVKFNQFGLGTQSADVTSYGGRLDVGYRWNFNPTWFVEPLATIQYVSNQFDDLVFPGTTASLDGDYWRGRLGARLGTVWVSGGWRLQPSVTASAWFTDNPNNNVSLFSGGFIESLADPNPRKTYGEIGGALSAIQLGGAWASFIKGDYRFADDYRGGRVQGGVRYQW